ncbi:MAG: phosphoribosylformylglycinamidine synthase subunit PurL [Pseudobdellovibrio sp.]
MILDEQLKSKLKTYRLSEEEYELMKSLLGRDPKPVEWPLFSALWSEHCSYKSSKVHLRKFSYRNERTPDMDGENAGVVDLGYGEKIAFKMESHNHPSFIEPVQGSATGVGGILRDIFTMGARPIMSANYLCFGEVNAPQMKYLMNGVAKGISSYGNCVGVPTVTGQTNINARYNKNILVNALNVGYFGPDMKMALSKAKGEKNLVVYVGAKTGRDGVHGASMASESFDEDSESKRPNVQIGDPFFEKLLIEACLEVLKKDLVVAMQDMGAAGLTSSSFEMASKGQVGFVIDLKKVPLRDSTMTAEDILLSESQERMLLICEPKNLEKLQNEFKKWSLDAVVLGEVQKDRKVKLMWGVEILTEIDPDLIVEKAPQYKRPYSKWAYPNRVDSLTSPKFEISKLVDSKLQSFKLNQHHWIHNQYDQRVGARTAMACESSVAFARLDHSGRGLSLAVGCRPEVMLMDAEIGALDAVYYPAFQMAIKGAETLAVTDCLNFGNPQKNEIMSEFVASVEAIADAAKKLDAPVISGNVSFYNETLGENIISTPATGLVGLRETVENLVPDSFSNAFENIILVQMNWVESWNYVEQTNNRISKFKQNANLNVPAFIKKCVGLEGWLKQKDKKISAIKAVGLGGIGATCLKMSQNNIGFDLSYDLSLEDEANMFKDVFYSFIVVTGEKTDEMLKLLKSYFSDLGVDVKKIGETKNEEIIFSQNTKIDFKKFQKQFSKDLEAAGL